MRKGDIVKNTCQCEGNPYRYQVVTGTFGGKGINTIDYLGNTHTFDNGTDHLEIVGHSKEYDVYMDFLKGLAKRKEDLQPHL